MYKIALYSAFVLCACIGLPCSAQDYQVTEITSPDDYPGGLFGFPLSSVEDIDGDGTDDVAVGAYREADNPVGMPQTGHAYLMSGTDGQHLKRLESPLDRSLNGGFSLWLAGVGDLGGDGAGDVAVSEGESAVFVFDGASGDTLFTVSPAGGRSNVTWISGLRDHTGDGVREFSASSYETDFGTRVSETVHVFDGSSRDELFTLSIAGDNSCFGVSVASLDDVDGDGTPDLIVGASQQPFGDRPCNSKTSHGRAYLFSGDEGSLIDSVASPERDEATSFHEFGFPVLGLDDLDGDGTGDFAVGAAFEGDGRVYVFSGATRSLLYLLESPTGDARTFFGAAMAGLPDTDGDGADDLLVGALADELGGRVHLFSGAGGAHLDSFASPNDENDGGFGATVVVLGDGRFVVGAPGESVEGSSDEGRAYLFTSTAGTNQEEVPRALPSAVLEPAYPNPFSSSSSFTLSTSKTQVVTIVVYDAMGRRVATLHDAPLAAGSHHFTVEGAVWSNGLYVIRVVGERFQVMRTIVQTR